MEGIRLPCPVPPAHLRNEKNEKSYQTSSVQRPQNDVRNNPHRSPEAGRRSRSSQKPNRSPKVGYSQSHSQGIGASRSTSPLTQITAVNPQRTRSRQPIHQSTLVQDVDQPPEVIIPPVTAPNLNQTVSATAVNRSDDPSSRVLEIQHSEEYDHRHRSRSQQRTRSPDPESDRSPERPGSRQGVVYRFTTRIPSRPHGHRARTPTPVILDPSIYARADDQPFSEPPSSECPTGDEAVTQHANGPRQTVQSDAEDRANQDGAVTVAMGHRRPDQIRLVKDRDRRIGQLKGGLAAAQRELENERQRRRRLELQVQSQQREMHSRMIQTEGQDDWEVVGHTSITAAHCQHDFRSAEWEKQDRWRKENDAKWSELQNDMKKVQEVLVEVRQRVLKINVEKESKPVMENAIEEIRKESAEQLELLSSLTESLRADSARRQDENIKLQERAPLDAQSYLESFSRPLASEVLTLLNEVGKLREERRSLQHELGSLLCMKTKYGPGGEFDPEWTPPEPTVVSNSSPVPLETPQQAKLTWRTVYPKLRRRMR